MFPPTQGLHGAEARGDPVVCPRIQARSRGKAVMCEPEGEKRPNSTPHPSPCWPFNMRPPSCPSCLVPSGWQRLASALRPLSRLGWYRGRPRPLPRSAPTRWSPASAAAGPSCGTPEPELPQGEEQASCRACPEAPDKLAICCCLLSAFVMQIPEPAVGAAL